MRKLSLAVLSILLAFICAGCSISPWESVARELSRLKTYEDIIKRLPAMATLVLSMDEAEIDANIFADTDMDSHRYAVPAYYAVEGTDWECTLLCQNAKVAVFELTSVGSSVTPAEVEDIIAYAVATYGADYESSETVDALAANTQLYIWEHTEIAFHSYTGDMGWIVIKFF